MQNTNKLNPHKTTKTHNMKNIKETIKESINKQNESLDQYYTEDTVRGYLTRHLIETPRRRVYPDHPLLPEPYVLSREQILKEFEAIQQMLERGEIDGKEAFVKTTILVDDYFNTLDAEEVKHICKIASEGSHNDLYTDE